MDFHSLTRRELQSLCKLNKIPANITNIAMADALKSLQIVEGIEEFLNPSRSGKAESSVESPEKIEVTSPRVPRTSCRTSTRQRVTKTGADTLPPTATRTTRCGTRRQLAGEVDESKNDALKTPAVFSSQRKISTSASKNMESQFNECKEDPKSEPSVDEEKSYIPNNTAAAITCSRRKRGATGKKEQSAVQKVYRTRRSARLTEKKSAHLSLTEKERTEFMETELFPDEVNQKEFSDSVEVPENIVQSGAGTSEFHESNVSSEVMEDNVGGCIEYCEVDNSKAELEDICNTFEELDVQATDESAPALLIDKAVNVQATTRSADEKGALSLNGVMSEKSAESNICSENMEDNVEGDIDYSDVAYLKAEQKDIANQIEEPGVLAIKESAPALVIEKAAIVQATTKSADEKGDCGELDCLMAKSDVSSNQYDDGSVGESLNVDEKLYPGEDDISESRSVELDSLKALGERDVLPAMEGSAHRLVTAKTAIVETTIKNADGKEDCGEPDGFEEKFNVREKLNPIEGGDSYSESGEVNILKAESDDINPCEDGDQEKELNIGEGKSDTSKVANSNTKMEDSSKAIKENNVIPVPDPSSLLYDHADFLPGTDHIYVEAIPLKAEMRNQVLLSNAYTDPVGDVMQSERHEMIANGTNEKVLEVMDDQEPTLVSGAPAEETEESLIEEIVVDVTPTIDHSLIDLANTPNSLNSEPPKEEGHDVILMILNTGKVTHGIEYDSDDSITKESSVDIPFQVSPTKEENQFRFPPVPCLLTQIPSNLSDHIPTPTKKTPMSITKMSHVSDDKENIDSGRKLQVVVDERKQSKKEKAKDEKLKSFYKNTSIRQLKKQLKALTLETNMNLNDGAEKVAKSRSALQALCDNQLAAKETKN